VSVPDDIDTSQFKHGVAQMKKSAHFGTIFPQPSRVGTSQPKSSVTLQRSNSLRHTKPPPPSSLPGLLVALPSALPQFVEPNRGCQPQPAANSSEWLHAGPRGGGVTLSSHVHVDARPHICRVEETSYKVAA
jgi:hypothetical protein